MNDDAERNWKSAGHEPIEADVRAVWRTAAVIAGVVIASYLLVIGMMKWFAATDGGPPANQQAKTDPNWDKQNPLQLLRVREAQFLTEYHWVDPESELARIPVDRAMEIIAENGLPASIQSTAQSPSASAPPAPAPTNSSSPTQADEP